MELRSIDILFKDKFAGTLIETPRGGTCFTYDQAWTEGIACCFPVVHREHEWEQGLHPFFEHLGPEGWLREQQARVAHIVEEDDIGLLLRYGADCIGAVSVRSREETIPVIEGTEAMANPGRTVSGVQKKLLVTKNVKDHFFPAPASGLAPYIAKFNSASIPTLVRNEALSLRWTASVLGKDEVNEFSLSHISIVNAIALVVTRFDRGQAGEKLRLEDCAQILCKPRGRDYAGKYDASYESVAAIITQHSVRPTIDLARFYRRLIAFTLVGNCDAHLKNFSLLETPDGLRLSPAYDVVNTAVYPEYDRKLALSIFGQKILLEEADSALFIDFGKAIGLPDKAIEQIFTDLKRQVQKAAFIIRPPDAEAPDGFVTRFEEIVRNTCFKILGD
jgi:serine/threonine-protein kinase HipA